VILDDDDDEGDAAPMNDE